MANRDIGVREVVADEQQRFATLHRQRIAETVSEIERCGVPTTPETQRSTAREHHLTVADWHHGRRDPREQPIIAVT